jgi:hypothetical protein
MYDLLIELKAPHTPGTLAVVNNRVIPSLSGGLGLAISCLNAAFHRNTLV